MEFRKWFVTHICLYSQYYLSDMLRMHQENIICCSKNKVNSCAEHHFKMVNGVLQNKWCTQHITQIIVQPKQIYLNNFLYEMQLCIVTPLIWSNVSRVTCFINLLQSSRDKHWLWVLLQIQYTEVTSSLSQPTKTKQLAKENKSATK